MVIRNVRNSVQSRNLTRLRAFTLIEILLVLVLLSLTAVAVIATIPTNAKDVAKQYAHSFYQRVQLLNEEAILSGLDFGIRVDDALFIYTCFLQRKKANDLQRRVF